MAISGETIVSGAYFHQVGSNSDQGAVYVYTMPAGGWRDGTETAELIAKGDGAGE